ncbi:MAG: hypothetical protein V4568_17575 [Pseudomonadota bacterium]
MASPLTRTDEQKPVVGKGHGTEALGPSDTSDTGSDVIGGPGLVDEINEDEELGLDRGTTSDPDGRKRAPPTGGPDVGDANLNSDSDSVGTGERASAARDVDFLNQDISPDSLQTLDDVVYGLTTSESDRDSNLVEDKDGEINRAKHNVKPRRSAKR